MRKVIGLGETVLDIIFKDDQPVAAVPGGSTFNCLISLGRYQRDGQRPCRTANHPFPGTEWHRCLVGFRLSRLEVTIVVGVPQRE